MVGCEPILVISGNIIQRGKQKRQQFPQFVGNLSSMHCRTFQTLHLSAQAKPYQPRVVSYNGFKYFTEQTEKKIYQSMY